MEKGKKLIESYIDPYTKRKYVYLTKKGASYVCEESKHSSPSANTIIHDTKVSMLTREFIKLELFRRFHLEHEDTVNYFKEGARADSVLIGRQKKKEIKIAFELELTRKSKVRVRNRILEHLSNKRFDYILYYFQDKSLLKAYKKIIEETYEDKASRRVLYALNPKLMLKDFKFEDTVVYAEGKVQNVLDVFDVSD